MKRRTSALARRALFQVISVNDLSLCIVIVRRSRSEKPELTKARLRRRGFKPAARLSRPCRRPAWRGGGFLLRLSATIASVVTKKTGYRTRPAERGAAIGGKTATENSTQWRCGQRSFRLPISPREAGRLSRDSLNDQRIDSSLPVQG